MWKLLCYAWSYWTAPIRNDHHKYLSLARIVFGISVVVFLVCALLAAMGVGQLSLGLIAGFCLLWILCWGDIASSKLSEDVLRIVAGRWGLPSSPEPALHPAPAETAAPPETPGAVPAGPLPEAEEEA